MSPNIDTDGIYQAYTDVRDDNNETAWALVKYAEDKSMVLHGVGTDYEEMISGLQEDERAYGYVRLVVGDELSKRVKFALITWIGPSVSPMKKAAVSTDKGTIKSVFQQFQIEVQADDLRELKKSELEALIRKAGGANYGTGVRD
ncbi:coactosin-like protein [Apostichopus japonicus]|uniref:Coactosin-like protein n=1 Tax=Stichopus japonicus TaxID=307972 RepID=A0A2G8LQU6_STIJA|nr:coactosin-like protein [Apostichopus japonicus]